MQLFTKWELITRTLRYVLGSRNDDLMTIGGHVLAVPSIEHHLVGGLTLISGLLMVISALVNIINPSLGDVMVAPLGGVIDSMGVCGHQ